MRVAWDKDIKPHVLFDIICDGYAASMAYGRHFQHWNKFSPFEICFVDGYGDEFADKQATLVSPSVYKCDTVIFVIGKRWILRLFLNE
jgi:hypothetical protein